MKFDGTREVSSAENKFVKLACSLIFKKRRLEEGLYIADGVKPVSEALKAGVARICFIDRTRRKALEKCEELLTPLRVNPPDELILLSDSLFRKIAPTDNPQGITALCRLPKYEFSEKEIEKIEPSSPFLPVLEDVSDPGNCGTIIRLAAGMGIREIVFLGEGADPYGPKVVRASAGVIVNLKIYAHRNSEFLLKRLKILGYKIIVADSAADKTVKGHAYPEKCALILGGEARGASKETLKLADDSLSIPSEEDIDSYNVATAAAIFFYEYRSRNLK